MENDAELIRVSMVDYFTKEVLVDSLVEPDTKIKSFNSQYSGVWPQDMEAAVKCGNVLKGKAGARQAIWRWVGPNTVMIGHSFQNDLSALRLIHHKVVDSFILEARLRKRAEEAHKAKEEKAAEMAEAAANDAGLGQQDAVAAGLGPVEILTAGMTKESVVAKNTGTLSLKSVTLLRLDRHIQVGKTGHDSLEDAIAARDLVQLHACLPEGSALEAIMRTPQEINAQRGQES